MQGLFKSMLCRSTCSIIFSLFHNYLGGIKVNISVSIKKINLLFSAWCNLHCKMCDYRLRAFGRKELSFEQITELIKDASKIGVELIVLSGGEPMTRKDIYEVIAFTSSLNIRTSMVTNGTLIGEEEAQKLVDSGLIAANISLEGFEEINDAIRGKGSFKKALNSISEFQKYRDKLQYINVGVTISKSNYKQLYDFTKFLVEEIGINSISYNPFDKEMLFAESYKDVKDMFCITPDMLEELSEELERILEYSKIKGIDIPPEKYLRKIPGYFAGESMLPKKPCYEPFIGCSINCTGEVYACWGEAEEVGNLNDASLIDIINSKEYKDMCIKAYTLKCKGCCKACHARVHTQ
jgi:MoaA/NifB/PqqE/SkfB family radical SAM enzyme